MKRLFLLDQYLMEKGICLRILGGFIILFSLFGCTADRFQQQTNTIKGHVEAFYDHLESHQVDKAMSENQRIERIALHAEKRLLRRVGQMNQGEKIQEWNIIKTAQETAAENWLALARYFSEMQQFHKAREIYGRIITTYQNSPYHSYVARAKKKLQDMDVIQDHGTFPLSPAK
jgi:tetratricopeptide (TPR) repeat protein